MKPPKNFYSNLDRRKQGLPEVPEASAADAGKIIKVGEDGSYELGNDENTIIIPNPETTPSATLNTLTIGSTTYKVNEARVTKILGLRFTINNGGAYNANLPVVSLVDIYGNAAVLPVYTMTCDKNIQYGGLTLSGTPGVLNENLPAAFTVIFNAEFNVEDYPYIKFSKTGLFPADSAKNLKIEYTLDNEGWVEIADLVSIDWSADDHVYDLSTGEEVETIPEIPTPTAADAGKVLGVDDSGAWELDNVPQEVQHFYATLDSRTNPTKLTLPDNMTTTDLIALLDDNKVQDIIATVSGSPNYFFVFKEFGGYHGGYHVFLSFLGEYGNITKMLHADLQNTGLNTIDVKTVTL